MAEMAAQTLETDDIKSVPLDVVSEGSPRHAGGRPRKMTVARFLRICQWIQEGRSNVEACRIEGADYSNFRANIRKRRRWTWRYEHANAIRDEFLRDVHLANIVRHAQANWQASAWILERKFPQLFALKSVNRDQASAEQPIGSEIPAERLARYGELMLQMAEEDRLREAAKAPRLEMQAAPEPFKQRTRLPAKPGSTESS